MKKIAINMFPVQQSLGVDPEEYLVPIEKIGSSGESKQVEVKVESATE